ncbi:ParB N-terminal domain-containing protein [Pantoea osteomyelitidis]|uniref:ParB N-terminal domain-containing protein n=1 Tax=Pantoea osteomyelitidis TaxID=3230026 RepID=A0ABW7PV86_9GAMM
MLKLNYDISALRGAEYNPRFIGEEDLSVLAESIQVLGLVKPLIVRGDLLVAGHQRTRALRKLGVTKAAVYVLPVETTLYDELRFNQLHNGTDQDSGDERCVITGLSNKSGFCVVQPQQLTGNFRSRMAYVRREISEMILRFGPWGGCVATRSGEVIHCAQYALASRSVNAPLTVYVIPDEKKALYRKYLQRTYGVFSYNHLEKHTYVQTYAQMMRLRSGRSKENRSRLYEGLVLPWLSSHQDGRALRGIDFGSGQGDYAKRLRQAGFNLLDVELFRRLGASNILDITSINRMITDMCDSLTEHGLFDYVICDSVLNSVDCPEAEKSVLHFIRGLCKPGGMLFFSGRRLEFELAALNLKKSASKKSKLFFLDENNFTAKYRKGHWFYQKFHSEKDIMQIVADYDLKLISLVDSKSSFQVQAVPQQPSKPDDLKKAISYEFELELPGNKRIGRSADVLRAFKLE